MELNEMIELFDESRNQEIRVFNPSEMTLGKVNLVYERPNDTIYLDVTEECDGQHYSDILKVVEESTADSPYIAAVMDVGVCIVIEAVMIAGYLTLIVE